MIALVFLAEVLLEPTRLYTTACLDLTAQLRDGVHAFTHVTGGGLAANLARVLPRGLTATVDRSTWTPAPVFGLVAELGNVPQADLERTLNMGVGMIAIVDAGSADAAVARLGAAGLPAWVAGEVAADQPDADTHAASSAAGAEPSGDVVSGTKGVDGGSVRMVGSHA